MGQKAIILAKFLRNFLKNLNFLFEGDKAIRRQGGELPI